MTTVAPGPAAVDADFLDAALDAFADRGYDRASVREIARDLGVSHNYIPQRFGSKERLWFAAVEHGFQHAFEEIVAATEGASRAGDPDHDPDELAAFQDAVVRFVEAMAARPALLRIIAQEATSPGPRLDHLYTTYIDPVRQLGDLILSQLAERGQVRTTSVSLIYFMMTHGAGGPLALPGLAERFGDPVDVTDPVAVHRYAVEAVDVLFHGLTVTEA
jgi:AcrR family transcriptional regulator